MKHVLLNRLAHVLRGTKLDTVVMVEGQPGWLRSLNMQLEPVSSWIIWFQGELVPQHAVQLQGTICACRSTGLVAKAMPRRRIGKREP
jgi:hypothetical protein